MFNSRISEGGGGLGVDDMQTSGIITASVDLESI